MSMIRLPRWLLLLLLGFLCLPIHVQAAGDGSEARMRRDITYLASDELEGRGIDTKGINLAADYIANEFKKAGLKSVGENGSYFQPFTATGRASLQGTNALMLRGPQGQEMQLQMGEHFTTIGYSGAGKVTAPVVFVG